jgi:hypothetical protein
VPNRIGDMPIVMRISIDDLPSIMEEFASGIPEHADVLRLCASLVNKTNLEWLQEPRIAQDDEKTRARKLLSELEMVQTFIQELHERAPSDEKDNVDRIWAQLQKVMRSLRLVG